jgi:RNA polymerase sigma-70 factor (ECF subfamily)
LRREFDGVSNPRQACDAFIGFVCASGQGEAIIQTVQSQETRVVPSARFVTTQWNVVLNAARDSATQAQALEELCRGYWYPLYAYVRGRGHTREKAQDLTQEFFARLLEKNWLMTIEPEGGRFRSFLLTAMNRFLANEYDRENAAKRSGGKQIVSLDHERAEQQYLNEPATHETPEKIFERRWAMAVLERALERLRQETQAAGKARLFGGLHPFISREPAAGEYAEVGAQLGIAAGAVAVAVHRLRTRYREMVRQEISNTLMNAAEVDEEMWHLFAVLRG